MPKKLIKNVFFAKGEEDLFQYANQIKHFSEWVKEKLKQEQSGEIDPTIKRYIESLVEAKLANMKVVSPSPKTEVVEAVKGDLKFIDAMF